MRTYRREDLERARAAWAEGEFGPAWRPYRDLAALNGIIFPPAGTRWDSWEDDTPTQRAMIARAMDETPQALRRAIVGSSNWSQVLTRLLLERDALRARSHEVVTVDRGPSRSSALELIRSIVRRITDGDNS